MKTSDKLTFEEKKRLVFNVIDVAIFSFLLGACSAMFLMWALIK